MDDAEVDLPHRGRVVVEQRDHLRLEGAPDRHLLVDLAPQRLVVVVEARPEQALVAMVDVASDADGPHRDQPLLSGPLAAHVVEQPVALPEEDVGDDLLPRGVVLGLRAWDEPRVLRLEDARDVGVQLRLDALERADVVEQGAELDVGELGQAQRQLGRVESLARDDDRSVAVAHARPTGHQGVAISEMGVGVNRDRGDLELSCQRAPVEALDVFQDLDDSEPGGPDLPLGDRVVHEGVVRIGRMTDADGADGRFAHADSLATKVEKGRGL